MTAHHGLLGSGSGTWQERLAFVLETVREMSRQADPQLMVRAYHARLEKVMPLDGHLSLSRRGLPPPQYRITRSQSWKEEINPWTEKERLPLLAGGLLGDLLYGNEPRLIDDLQIGGDDPGVGYLAGQRSLLAIPLFDGGVALNMVVFLRRQPRAFNPEQFPDLVLMTNLFGRAAHHLVLAGDLRRAHAALDREAKAVAGIQRSLLPAELPRIPTLDLAAVYQTAARAGGDYYDFFALPQDRWGFLIADVSGHGTPAAVMMAVTHAIAHTNPGQAVSPGPMLGYLNRQLATQYAARIETFVTAFYGVYDPGRRELTYANAGHPPPRLKRCEDGMVASLADGAGLPLGVLAEENYGEATQVLHPEDQVVFYTDGITEAHNPEGEMFGLGRLDEVLEGCPDVASELLDAVLWTVEQFTAGRPADDDRTLVVARVF